MLGRFVCLRVCVLCCFIVWLNVLVCDVLCVVVCFFLLWRCCGCVFSANRFMRSVCDVCVMVCVFVFFVCCALLWLSVFFWGLNVCVWLVCGLLRDVVCLFCVCIVLAVCFMCLCVAFATYCVILSGLCDDVCV